MNQSNVCDIQFVIEEYIHIKYQTLVAVKINAYSLNQCQILVVRNLKAVVCVCSFYLCFSLFIIIIVIIIEDDDIVITHTFYTNFVMGRQLYKFIDNHVYLPLSRWHRFE